jgi:hypothetical protein
LDALFCEFWVEGEECDADEGLEDDVEVEDDAAKAEVVPERFERV